jgi:hypothetical protein
MKITEAISFLGKSKKETNKKSRIKSYKTFIAVLTDLQSKDLSQEEFQEIEKQLENLQLSSKPRFKELNRNFSKLQQFLKVKFSLTIEGHYTSLGIAIGMCFGIPIGAMIESYIGASLGMTLGMLIGIAIGKSMDSKAEIYGNSLKTTL